MGWVNPVWSIRFRLGKYFMINGWIGGGGLLLRVRFQKLFHLGAVLSLFSFFSLLVFVLHLLLGRYHAVMLDPEKRRKEKRLEKNLG